MKKLGLSLKMCIVCIMAIAVMGITVFADSYSWNTAFTVAPGDYWDSEYVKFNDTKTHSLYVDFKRTESKGNIRIAIVGKPILGVASVKSSKNLSITTATTGIAYTFDMGSISSGYRNYTFDSNDTAKFTIASFRDNW